MLFAVRAIVMASIAIAFYLVRGFGSILETFAMALVASLVSHGVVIALRRVPKPWAAVSAISSGFAAALASAVTSFYLHHPQVRAIPYVPLEQLDPSEHVGDELKVHGTVAPGSIERRIVDQQSETRFELVDGTRRLGVRSRGPLPDTFRDLADVVVQGRVTRAGDDLVLVATEVSTKCPDRYGTGTTQPPRYR